MTCFRRKRDILAFSRSARSDVRPWAMFIVGAIFVWAAYSIDPLENCDDTGECAPWLIPIAGVLGGMVGLGGLGQLLANPNRGSSIDPTSGELVWWQNRFGASGGDEGQIDPLRIGTIRIIKMSDNSNEVHLYDQGGVRQFYFDEEVITIDQEAWAAAMADRWPHITVEIIE